VKPVLVFDVESMGLHGEAFSVGAVVGVEGRIVSELYLECPTAGMACRDVDYRWLREECLPHRHGLTHATPRAMRDAFWTFWLHWKSQGAELWADCGWPCEARFLAACVDDSPDERWWQGPFTLLDIAQVVDFHGSDVRDAALGEKPVHDPLADARFGFRKLVQARVNTAR
jgi:hypothetical protein